MRTRPVEVIVQGQPVQSEPRRRSREGTDRPRQDRPDAGRLDAGDHQSGLDPMRDRGGGLRLHQGAVAALVHRPAGQSGGRSAGLEAVQLHLSLFLGTRRHHRGLHQHVESGRRPTRSVGGLFPNDGDGNAWGDKQVGLPPALDKAGFKLFDPGRYQNLTDNFSAQINAFKEANCADHHRRRAAAGLHHLLEAGVAARLQAEGGLGRQGDPVPGRGRGARQGRQQSVVGSLVVAEPSVQVVAQRHEREAARRRLRAGHQEAMDAADRLHPFAVRGRGRRAEAHARRSATPRRRSMRSPRPISTPSSARCSGTATACRPSPPRTSPRRRWSAASGASSDGNKYDIVITDNKTAPNIPVGGKMEPIA